MKFWLELGEHSRSGRCVRAPEFTGILPAGTAQFQVNLRGQPAKRFTLYASPDLVNWSNLGFEPNPNGAIQFIYG